MTWWEKYGGGRWQDQLLVEAVKTKPFCFFFSFLVNSITTSLDNNLPPYSFSEKYEYVTFTWIDLIKAKQLDQSSKKKKLITTEHEANNFAKHQLQTSNHSIQIKFQSKEASYFISLIIASSLASNRKSQKKWRTKSNSSQPPWSAKSSPHTLHILGVVKIFIKISGLRVYLKFDIIFFFRHPVYCYC